MVKVGSLVKLGPDDNIFFQSENGSERVYLESFECGIVTRISSWSKAIEYEVLIGNQIFSVLKPNNMEKIQ